MEVKIMNKESDLLKFVKEIFQYTDEQVGMVASNPKLMDMIKKVPQLISTDFVFEIEKAHGCGCQHQPGQQIKLNGNGALACGNSHSNICIYLLQSFAPIVYGAQEFIYAGLDPNNMKFTTVGCLDVGAKCGGFGHVTVNFKAISKQ